MSTPTYSFTVPAPSAEVAPPTVSGKRHGGSKALWLVGIGLVLNAGVMLMNAVGAKVPELVLERGAFGQAAPGGGALLGARGISMMPGQLGPNTYGLYLLDVDSGTICVYRANPDSSHFRLMASRSYKSDRFLEDFNNEGLRPKDVQKLVEEQRVRLEQVQKDTVPSVDQNPKPDPNLPDAAPGGVGGNK